MPAAASADAPLLTRKEVLHVPQIYSISQGKNNTHGTHGGFFQQIQSATKLLRAESIAPAANPGGTANRHSSQRFPEKEKPSRAAAAKEVLMAVMPAVPNRETNRTLIRLEIIVQPDINRVMQLAAEMGR